LAASIAELKPTGHDLETIYVDSNSTDDSLKTAANFGAKTLLLDDPSPSAAKARNKGWRHAKGDWVLFLDGDTELYEEFLEQALAAMQDPTVAVVCGQLHETHPEQSIYVRALDLDWVNESGQVDFCGGNALFRRHVLQTTGGFDSSLIAGEEPELCQRIRRSGYTILQLATPMVKHDLGIVSFTGYWRRSFRSGYAYAEISQRFLRDPNPLWKYESRRNVVHGVLLLLLLTLSLIPALWPYSWIVGASLVGLLVFRTMRRTRHRCTDWYTRLIYALHSQFSQIPILLGQMAFYVDRWRGCRRGIVEY
jgi:cellulose synthase/poly-beta-1,6-N-acetylglucosamine synthase-like glycosyltransferase